MNTVAFAISLDPPPFFRDHHLNGRPVLAAVEAMERLVADTCARFSGSDGRRLSDVRFDKFLYLDGEEPPAAFNRVDQQADGTLRSTLTTRFRSTGTAIARTLTHAALSLDAVHPAADGPPVDAAACLTGAVIAVDPERIYRELVPFGPAYRNIRGRLLLSEDGALARVGSPHPADPRGNLELGSPYVLDAAFHAACVWCQRYRGIVAFPVSIDRRTVALPTRLDETYAARILPVRIDNEPFVFDILIYDDAGRLRERAGGVHMRDVSGGRSKPPPGFWSPAPEDALDAFNPRLTGSVVVERAAVADFAPAALTVGEKRRLAPMTPDRASGYLSARLALKRLSRRLSGSGDRRLAHEIETVAADGRSPRCPLADDTHPYCSVAHDRRFSIAVAAERPVGVDVEPLSEKPLKAPGLFMDEGEQALIHRSTLERAAGALRVWSAKEAAAKALGFDLADAWERVRVKAMDAAESRLLVDGKSVLTAHHALLEGHLFTLLVLEAGR